jgi:hypothetical protein
MWVVLVLAGCDQGHPVACCVWEDGRALFQGYGRVTQCPCASNAVCDYPRFTRCEDDATHCVVQYGELIGVVTCGDGTEPTIEAPCCVDRGEDGVGTRSMCECPVFGTCEGGLHGEWIESVDDTRCRLTPAPWIDAGVADAADPGSD